jgi:hypothetical protein
MVLKYKLTIVEKEENSKLELSFYHEVSEIGIFDNEEELIQWAKENKGELEKC